MLFEYAVEPELVATWADWGTGRYFIDRFGVGSPRFISRYPKSWKKRVWEAWKAIEIRDGPKTDRERKRMEALILGLSSVMVKRRGAVWDPDRSWVENAVAQQVPFHAVLTRHNPDGDPQILVADELDDPGSRWAAPRGMMVRRTARAIAETVGGMLRIATDVIFVDPYFAPHRGRFVDVIAACMEAGCRGRAVGPARVRIFSSDREELGTYEYFRTECLKRLPGELPADQEVVIHRLVERTGGERLHNRYILTELGGVAFGFGLDEDRKRNTMDDVNLLESDQYHRRWAQYAGEPAEFDRFGDAITIIGSRR